MAREETISYTEDRFYNLLKDEWKSPVVKGIAIQLVGILLVAIIVMIIKHLGIETPLSLPAIDIKEPPLTLSNTVIAVFQVTITVSGIILGFGAVCVFFMLERMKRRIDYYSEQSRKLRNKDKKDEWNLRIEITEGMARGFSKYAEFFARNAIGLTICNILIFVFSCFLGLFLLISLMLSLNSVLVVSCGFYPLIRFVLFVIPTIKDELTKSGFEKEEEKQGV